MEEQMQQRRKKRSSFIMLKYDGKTPVQTDNETNPNAVYKNLNFAVCQAVSLYPAHHADDGSGNHDDGAQPENVDKGELISFKGNVLENTLVFLHTHRCFVTIHSLQLQ